MLNKKQAFRVLKEMINSKGYQALPPSSKRDALFELVNRTSVSAKGSTTIVYSGTVDGKKANEAALDMYNKNKKDFRIIDKTPAGKLLLSKQFNTALYATVGVNKQEYQDYLRNRSSKSVEEAIESLNPLLYN